MKSLLTLERNFLSPDVPRRETIYTSGKASISCRQYDAEVDDKLSETMNEKENWNKEDSVAKVICHAQHSAKKKLLGKSPSSTCKKNPQVIVSATEIKSNSSFFNKDEYTTLPSNMNATQLHFDSSDSEEDLNSRRKKNIDPNKSYNEQRLHMEMAILREMREGKEIAEISWVPSNTQIADSMTKKGMPSFKILGFMSEPKESSVKCCYTC